MGWMQSLYKTYDNCEQLVGKEQNGHTLLPICHLNLNVQLEITLSENGELISAHTVDKNDAETIMPVTEDSGNRTSGMSPMPLCDKLKYIAGDYGSYTEDKKNDACEYYSAYIKALKAWADSPYSDYMVKSVYTFLSKGDLIKQLSDKGVLKLDDDGMLDSSVKTGITAQPDYFARFRVSSADEAAQSATWLSTQMYENFIKFYESREAKTDLCFVTGKSCVCAEKHPAKLRNAGDKAKLISTNDSFGFTYRGRFDKPYEAYSVSFEVSQKAHNALRWLIERQGMAVGDMSFVVWNVENKPVPEVNKSTFDFYGNNDEAKKVINANKIIDVKTSQRLIDAVFGSTYDLKPKDTVVYMAVEAATTGRLSITAYEELSGSDFLNNIASWHKTCCWYKTYKNSDETYTFTPCAPSLYDIIRSVKGIEAGQMLDVKSKQMSFEMKRLLPCVISSKPIPIDYVKGAYLKASNRVAYNSKKNYAKVLHTACSIILKYYNSKGENYTMALQQERTDRSYLYGRLLAVARKIEETVLRAGDVSRLTNAERYMNAFSKQPCKTWGHISNMVNHYIGSLKPGQKYYYEKLLNGIYSAFKDGDFEDNSKLDEAYLLGYRCQLDSFYIKKTTEEDK